MSNLGRTAIEQQFAGHRIEECERWRRGQNVSQPPMLRPLSPSAVELLRNAFAIQRCDDGVICSLPVLPMSRCRTVEESKRKQIKKVFQPILLPAVIVKNVCTLHNAQVAATTGVAVCCVPSWVYMHTSHTRRYGDWSYREGVFMVGFCLTLCRRLELRGLSFKFNLNLGPIR